MAERLEEKFLKFTQKQRSLLMRFMTLEKVFPDRKQLSIDELINFEKEHRDAVNECIDAGLIEEICEIRDFFKEIIDKK